jgi:hypothetical protein
MFTSTTRDVASTMYSWLLTETIERTATSQTPPVLSQRQIAWPWAGCVCGWGEPDGLADGVGDCASAARRQSEKKKKKDASVFIISIWRSRQCESSDSAGKVNPLAKDLA